MKRYQAICCLTASLVFGACINGIAADISVKAGNGVTEITGSGGVSRVGVNEGCVNGNGIKKTEQRKVSPFNAVKIEGSIDAAIELQKKLNLELTGDSNILPYITTTVQGDTLVVSSDRSICPKINLKVNVSNMNIEKVVSSGSSDITIVRVRNKAFSIDITGAGDISVTGSTGKFAANLAGSGSLKAKDLRAEDAEIAIIGAGDADVYASGKLKASIEGAGDIRYYGNPKEVSQEISGAGDIIKK